MTASGLDAVMREPCGNFHNVASRKRNDGPGGML